jgi:hypothetical protein
LNQFQNKIDPNENLNYPTKYFKFKCCIFILILLFIVCASFPFYWANFPFYWAINKHTNFNKTNTQYSYKQSRNYHDASKLEQSNFSVINNTDKLNATIFGDLTPSPPKDNQNNDDKLPIWAIILIAIIAIILIGLGCTAAFCLS